MARPKLKSDDEVLDAANAVLKRRGPLDFTLNDVAQEVGLSRAAVIQRFTNKETLLIRMMERDVGLLREHLERLPREKGPEGVWAFLQALVRGMGHGYTFSVNALIFWHETQIPELQRLSGLRTRYVHEAIRQRLPPGAPAGTAALLHSVIGGAAMQWLSAPRRKLADYVLAQVKDVLQLLFPKTDFGG